MFHIQVEDELFGKDLLECFATKILDAKYESANTAKVVERLTQLNVHQKPKSRFALSATKNKKMFNGTLCVYPHKTVHIDIGPNAKHVHSRPYPVP